MVDGGVQGAVIMKILIISLLIVAMTVLSFGEVESDYDKWNGSEYFKLGVVYGLGWGKDFIDYIKQHKNILYNNLGYYHLSADGATYGEVRNAINKVYSKPANRSIPMALAY